MYRWQVFAWGVAAGLVLAAGFGFALAERGSSSDGRAAAPPAAPEVAPYAERMPPAEDGKLRILVFGAHPDDAEIRAGGTAMLWAQQGHHVKFISATNGDIGHWGMAGGALARRRYAEVQEAARILGVVSEVFDIHDGELEPTLENRRKFTRAIRWWNADIVIGHRPNDYHPDHRYVGVLMQDSAYMTAVPFFCPDAPPLAKNPVYLYSYDRFQLPTPFRPDVVVAIDEVIEAKVDALAVMDSQFVEGGALGNASMVPRNDEELQERRNQVRERFRKRFADIADSCREQLVALYGEDAGRQVRYAEAFEICEYGRQPTAEEIRTLFPFFPPRR